MTRLATLLLVAASVFAGAPTASADALTFGVVPQQAASKLARLWSPILQAIGRRTGQEIRFATAPDIPTFEQRLAAGEYDFAYMNPYHYTVFHEHPGYVAMAHARDRRVRGIIVVRVDSPLTDIAELDGATLAFPAPAAFAASVLPRASFEKRGIAITPEYVSSHDSVYRAVAKGLFPAGGGVQRTLDSASADVREQLRVLWTTDAYTPHAIAAHPRVPAATVAAVRDALVALDADEDGRALLAALSVPGFEAAEDSAWDDVRALDIRLLDRLIVNR